MFDEIAIGTWFGLLEVIILTHISLGIVKNSSDYFWRSDFLLLYCQYKKKLQQENEPRPKCTSETTTSDMFFRGLLSPRATDPSNNQPPTTYPPTQQAPTQILAELLKI